MNNLALSVNLATAPSSAFAELRERPRFWLPLLLLVAATAVTMFWYHSIVDVEWLKDLRLSSDADLQKRPAEEREVVMGMYTRNTLVWGSVVGAVLGTPIILLLSAAYLLLAARATKLSPGFKHWFAFACWTSLPLLIGSLVTAILLLLSDTPQIGMGVLQPLSLNELVFQRPPGSPGQAMLDSLGIPGFISWALMIVGVRVWSQRSWAFSVVFICLPIVVIYGIWAFFFF